MRRLHPRTFFRDRDKATGKEYLQLSNSTNATVHVSITTSAIRFRVNFNASLELNGTIIKCYSEIDVGREDFTTISITGKAGWLFLKRLHCAISNNTVDVLVPI